MGYGNLPIELIWTELNFSQNRVPFVTYGHTNELL